MNANKEDQDGPMVSCVLVTRDRWGFVGQAIRCYQRQTYRNSELIVVDDGETAVGDLCVGPGITYIRLDETTPTGKKLNIGIAAARGAIIQNLDDDDYYGPEFLEHSVQRLMGGGSRENLVAWCCFLVLVAGEPDLIFSGHGWQAGGTLAFWRELWERVPYREMFQSYDSYFIRDHNPAGPELGNPNLIRVCRAAEQYILVRHGGNTWLHVKGHQSVEGYFRTTRKPYEKSVEEVVGAENAEFYRGLMKGTGGPVPGEAKA